MKALIKEIWEVYLPKCLKTIYGLVLKPESSIAWVAGVILAIAFYQEDLVWKVLGIVNAIPAAIICFKHKTGK